MSDKMSRRKSSVNPPLVSQTSVLSQVAGSLSNIHETEEIERKLFAAEKNDVIFFGGGGEGWRLSSIVWQFKANKN